MPGIPVKIERVAVIDAERVAVINENNFALSEFEESGRHAEPPGVQSRMPIIETPFLL